MALTRDFKETVAARLQDDPAFAQALLDEAITLFVNGEPESPDGHPKLPHLWPVKLPQPGHRLCRAHPCR